MSQEAGAGKTKTLRPRKPKRNPLLNWIIKAGIGSECFGWGGLLLVDLFWPAVIFIYLGFLLFAIDVCLEPELRGHPSWRLTGVGLIVGCTILFSWAVVMVDAPLVPTALMTNGEYPVGTVIDGIKWRPEFTELVVELNNPTEKPYDDLNIVIRPGDAIAAIKERSSFGVIFDDKINMVLHMLDVDQLGNIKAVPIRLIATDAGYRMRCQHLPGKSVIKITVALADIKWNPQLDPNIPIAQAVRDPNYILRLKDSDFGSYWLGYEGGDVFATRPTSSASLRVDGCYIAIHRKRCMEETVQYGSVINIKRQ